MTGNSVPSFGLAGGFGLRYFDSAEYRLTLNTYHLLLPPN
jgi:hypothetical protein